MKELKDGEEVMFLAKCQQNNSCIFSYHINEPFTLCNKVNLYSCSMSSLDNCATKYISFQTVCDGFQELWPIVIDGTNHSDETKCHYWKCNNTYTRCNCVWNCLNGADEHKTMFYHVQKVKSYFVI